MYSICYYAAFYYLFIDTIFCFLLFGNFEIGNFPPLHGFMKRKNVHKINKHYLNNKNATKQLENKQSRKCQQIFEKKINNQNI